MLDIWNHIASFIKDDKTKCCYIRTTNYMPKCDFYFNDMIEINKIVHSRWFNKFTNILVNDTKITLPFCVTKLTLGFNFNYRIENFIPSTVIDLDLGDRFNAPIKGCIPSSVTHLRFGWNFNQEYWNDISSVTHLTFSWYCNYINNPDNNSIPSSVTHVTIEKDIDAIFKKIPRSILNLTLGSDFRFYSARGKIPSSIKELIIQGSRSEDEIKKIIEYCSQENIRVFFQSK